MSTLKNTNTNHASNEFVFGKRNYQLLIGAIALIVIGFVLMAGGKPTNPNEFVYNDMFSFTRITVAPVTVLAGFVMVVFAIMHKTTEE
jgi:hypothetical protein